MHSPQRQGPEHHQWQSQASPWSPSVWAHKCPGSSVLAAQLYLVAKEGSPHLVALQLGGQMRLADRANLS